MERAGLGSALRRGLWVLLALAVLTVVEYVVPLVLEHGAFPYLVPLALVKAGIIGYYFMHLAQLWREEK